MASVREIRLKSRPVGAPTHDNFEVATVDLPAPAAGEVQVKNLWMSVDPYMRGRMNDRKSYVGAFQIGKPLEGGAIGEVVASADPAFKAGDMVQSNLGWREGFNAPADALKKLDARGLPPEAQLGVAGMTGLTAYVGLLRIAAMKDGDVVFVSGAAGAVGVVAVQIAKAKGHTVIGSAGGPAKVAFLKQLGVDHVIDYKAEKDLKAALLRAAPDGIDVYFDNVGGDHLEAAISAARPFARFALCGGISAYNLVDPPPGPRNMMEIIVKQMRLEGYLLFTHFDMLPDFERDVTQWMAEGKLVDQNTVFEGIERAPDALLGLFTGENLGKMLVKLA
jgi:NADPH-dependent curcumin reductase CurA